MSLLIRCSRVALVRTSVPLCVTLTSANGRIPTNNSIKVAHTTIVPSYRTFFWRAKPEPIVDNPHTTVTTIKEVPDTNTNTNTNEQQQTTVNEDAKLKDKATRLGFSGVTDAINKLLSSWPHIKTYATWVAVGTGMLFVFKGGLNIVEYFATINFLDVGEVAFIAGLLSGIGLVACGWLGTRFLRLRPEPIFQHALKRINTDSTVVQYMGRNIEPSNFRAYSFVNGTIRMTQEQRDRAIGQKGIYKWWQPKRLQLFFQVTGSNGAIGMVSAEVEKNWKGDFKYNLLSVDLQQTGERIVLEGDVSYQIYKGIIKLR